MQQQNKAEEFDIHIGKLIQEELKRQGRRIDWFASQLCCDRSNIYKLYKRRSLDTDLLLHISEILEFDFFEVYSQNAKWKKRP